MNLFDPMSHRRLMDVLALLLTLGLLAPAVRVLAQDAEISVQSAPTISFTLASAVSRAVDQNPDFRILQARLDQQEAGIRLLLARILPTATLTGTYTHNDQGVQLGGSTVVEQDELSFRGDLSVTLLRPRALGDYLVAGREMEAARLDARYSRAGLILAVIELYIGVIRARESREAARSSLGRRESFLVAAQERLRYGLTDRSEVQRAELSVLEAQVQLDQAASQEELAREALAVVLDLPVGTPLELVGDAAPPGFGRPPVPDAASFLEPLEDLEGGFSPENRDDLQAARQQRERDSLARTFTWLDFLPEIVLNGGFTQGPTTFRDPDGFSWQIVLRALFTLYDGGARYGIMHQEEATRALHLAEVEAAQARVQAEVRSSALSVRALEQEWTTAMESLAVARSYWSDAVRRRDAGLGSMLEVLDAEEQLSAIEVRTRVLQQDLWLAQWRLVHARGELLGLFGS